MNFLNDPMAAAFIPLGVLLLFSWIMAVVITGDPDSDGWWVNMLTGLHLAPKQPEPETPIHTSKNVLDITPGTTPAAAEVDVIDYRPYLRQSKRFFATLGTVMILLTAFHGFRYYRRQDPYFLWGPGPQQMGPASGTKLPPPVAGAGGAGPIGGPRRPATVPNQGGTARPGGTGQPGGLRRPGMLPGQGGMPGQPGMPGQGGGFNPGMGR